MYVYVIASGPRAVKIGFSIDPERRVQELQTGHERHLSLVHKEPVSDIHGPLLEKLIHRANRHKTLRGEWFDLTHEEAILEVKFAVIRYTDSDTGLIH
jgi:hypothetical protein